jgi:hypothetical protein
MARYLAATLAVAAARLTVAQDLSTLTQVQPSTSARISSASPDAWSNADNRRVAPGETLTMGELQGPGVIRHIWLTFPDSAPGWFSDAGSADPSEIVLRMYWDGAAEPAVESPLGDFFACGFGRRAEVRSAPVAVQGGDSYNCYWPMPFSKSARITVANQSTRPLASFYFQIDYTREESLPDNTAYFCAQYRQEFPTRRGGDYLIADIEAPDGGGHYVGTVMSVRSRSPQWFGEGDDKFFIDGASKPSLWGTGTEDYFSNAWGMEKATFPSFGVTQLDGWLADLGETGTMYRWHLADPIRFRKSLRFVIEHKGWMSADETTTGRVEGHVEREDDFATVAFWYQRGQPKRFATLPGAPERRLPPIDTIIPGKELAAGAKADGGAVSVQAGGLWTGEGQLFFDGQKVGSWVEFAFRTSGPERRRFVLPLTHSYDFGIYRVSLDGRPLGDWIDLYSPTVEVREHNWGDEPPLAPGDHTVRMECVGQNPNSSGCRLGVDSVRLRGRTGARRPPLGPGDE